MTSDTNPIVEFNRRNQEFEKQIALFEANPHNSGNWNALDSAFHLLKQASSAAVAIDDKLISVVSASTNKMRHCQRVMHGTEAPTPQAPPPPTGEHIWRECIPLLQHLKRATAILRAQPSPTPHNLHTITSGTDIVTTLRQLARNQSWDAARVLLFNQTINQFVMAANVIIAIHNHNISKPAPRSAGRSTARPVVKKTSYWRSRNPWKIAIYVTAFVIAYNGVDMVGGWTNWSIIVIIALAMTTKW